MTYKVLFIFTVCFNVPSLFKFKVGLSSYVYATQNLQALLQRVILLIFSKSVFSLWLNNCLVSLAFLFHSFVVLWISSHATLHNRTSRSQINHSLNLFWLPLLLLLFFSVNRTSCIFQYTPYLLGQKGLYECVCVSFSSYFF